MSEQFFGKVKISKSLPAPGTVATNGGSPFTIIGLDGDSGDVTIHDGTGTPVFRFNSRFALLDIGGQGNEGDIRVRDNADNIRIHLDGNSGDIKLTGADFAEEFDVAESEQAEPGTVLAWPASRPAHCQLWRHRISCSVCSRLEQHHRNGGSARRLELCLPCVTRQRSPRLRQRRNRCPFHKHSPQTPLVEQA